VAAFLEELLVRRELGFNYCLHTEVKAQLRVGSLPRWAQQTLRAHGKDRREHLYDLDALDRAETSDPLWNAAQRELRQDGRIHGYLRMLWGKKILEWSRSPQEALDHMAHLNDRYALDGRDPVSVANFMWVLGLHDRPFQERPVLGKVRPMSSLRTAEKVDLGPYLARYGGPDAAEVKLPRRRKRAARTG
jgi:deoxyribodipyrimidine photo-lyase